MKKNKKIRKNRMKTAMLGTFILLCFFAAALLLYRSVKPNNDKKETQYTYVGSEGIYDITGMTTEAEASPEASPETSHTVLPEASPEVSLEVLPEATVSSHVDPIPGSGTVNPLPLKAFKPIPAPTATPPPEPIIQAPSARPLPTPIAVKNESIPQRRTIDRSKILSYFNSLLDVNEDIRGYIEIPGTNISYPVVQGIDNEFYLKRNIYGNQTVSASIFMDYRNNTKSLDDNTIIYGHNLRTTMFNDLDYFVDENTREAYLKAGGIFRFDTAYEAMSWEIYSAYVVNKYDFNYLTTNFTSERLHIAFLEETMERSFVDTGITVTTDDRILTLSTCNHWFVDSRTVIHARLIGNEGQTCCKKDQ